MRREIVLASHGHLAEGLLDTLMMILGELPHPTRALCLLPGESPDLLARELEHEVREHPETRFIILVDLFGASVFTSLCRLSPLDNAVIVAGMNVSLALAALTEEDASSERSLSRWGMAGIRGCREALQAEANDRNDF